MSVLDVEFQESPSDCCWGDLCSVILYDLCVICQFIQNLSHPLCCVVQLTVCSGVVMK